MEDRHQSSDNYRHRDRSPAASRYRDRSSEKCRDRSRDRYRSSRYPDRNRSGSQSRSRRSDRYRSKSRSRGDRRSSRSRSPRRHHYSSSASSRYYSSKSSRHHRRSRSNSSSSSPSRRTSPHNDRIPPPPPSFPKSDEYDDDYTNSDPLDTDPRPVHIAPVASTISPAAEPAAYRYNGGMTDWSKSSGASIVFEHDEFDEPIDKERIHREMEEKLRLALAKEGKVYPPPKPEPSHPVFANDGSFLEIFKQMQQQMTPQSNGGFGTTSGTDAAAAEQQRLRNQPICKRRGGKILKTGMVAKTRATDTSSVDPKDFWSIYLQEVKKYKDTSCDVDSKTRPLIK